jgi:hypothetical protein
LLGCCRPAEQLVQLRVRLPELTEAAHRSVLTGRG